MKPRDENKIRDIYRATLDLVKEKGLAGVTMGQIAKQAGLATGTVYIYFASKDELINSLFSVCRKASAEVYFKGYDPRAPFKEGFRTVWMNVMNYRLEKFEEAVFIEQCYHSPFINADNRDIASQALKTPILPDGKREKTTADPAGGYHAAAVPHHRRHERGRSACPLQWTKIEHKGSGYRLWSLLGWPCRT